MRTILKNTEVGTKYFLCFVYIFISFVSVILLLIVPTVWDDLMVFFFIPYIPLIMALLLCWDIINEGKWIHRIIGIILILIIIYVVLMAYNEIGFPGQDTFLRWSSGFQKVWGI